MNSVAALAAGRAPQSAASRAAAGAAARRAAAKRLHRRPRPVGRQLEPGGAPASCSPPVGELRAPAPRPAASSRCQTAKSAYWTGSSGSGDGRPAAKAP